MILFVYFPKEKKMQRKIYVNAESKAFLKRRIKNDFNSIVGTEYNSFNPDGYETYHYLADLSDPTIIAIYNGNKNPPSMPHVWGVYYPENRSLK